MRITKWKGYSDKVYSRLGWYGAALVLLGYYLNANQYLASWPVWILGNCLVGGYSLHKGAVSTAVMSFLIALLNIYGYFKWVQ
jgi:hypothetical protein